MNWKIEYYGTKPKLPLANVIDANTGEWIARGLRRDRAELLVSAYEWREEVGRLRLKVASVEAYLNELRRQATAARLSGDENAALMFEQAEQTIREGLQRNFEALTGAGGGE